MEKGEGATVAMLQDGLQMTDGRSIAQVSYVTVNKNTPGALERVIGKRVIMVQFV